MRCPQKVIGFTDQNIFNWVGSQPYSSIIHNSISNLELDDKSFCTKTLTSTFKYFREDRERERSERGVEIRSLARNGRRTRKDTAARHRCHVVAPSLARAKQTGHPAAPHKEGRTSRDNLEPSGVEMKECNSG